MAVSIWKNEFGGNTMSSLQELCNNPVFPELQRKFSAEWMNALRAEFGDGTTAAVNCLRRLWGYYDSGGHSMGRSLRSFVLEKILDFLRKNGEEKAKVLLGVLVAMHYDYEYINRHKWFDYELADMADIPIRDRAHVSAAASMLGIEEIPSLEDWSTEKIRAFVSQDQA